MGHNESHDESHDLMNHDESHCTLMSDHDSLNMTHKTSWLTLSYRWGSSAVIPHDFGVIMSHNASWWVTISHNVSSSVINMTHDDAWWLHGPSDFMPQDRPLSRLKKIQIGSSAFAPNRLLWLKDRLLWLKDRLLWPLNIVRFHKRSSDFARIVYFETESSALILLRIVCFRPYSLRRPYAQCYRVSL